MIDYYVINQGAHMHLAYTYEEASECAKKLEKLDPWGSIPFISKRSEKGAEELLREVMHLFNSEITDRIQTENDNAN